MPLFGGYDFDAADYLERVLNEASGMLRNLLVQRGKWVSQYLAYPVNGPLQGWVGAEYTTWGRQFNESQSLLARGVNDLCGRAVDVHNASYFADTTPNSTRTMLFYPFDQTWSGAPRNPAPEGTEGATPQNLYDYSDNATRANDDQFRSFFSVTLAGAASAAPTADAAPSPGKIPAPSSLARSISWILRNKILVLDARVRMVGEAFEAAGNATDLTRPNDQRFLTFQSAGQLESVISNQLLPDIQSAIRLANYTGLPNNDPSNPESNGIDDYVLQQLYIHEDDPAFIDAFLRNLPTDVTDKGGYTPLQALILGGDAQDSAEYASVIAHVLDVEFRGGENDSFRQQLASFIVEYGTGEDPQFIQQLSGDPEAALGFPRLARSD